jgi:DNA-binding response OmpR family regulator
MAVKKPVLLIVEDDPEILEMLVEFFRVGNYSVFPSEEGKLAVRLCRQERIDLVILDIRLPDFDGYEVARRLRTNHLTRGIPIIFLTEKRNKSDKLQGLELGVDDYITKPFDILELQLRVENALRRSTRRAIRDSITRLPSGDLVDQRLIGCLQSDNWALLLISLQNLDYFRDHFGFVASDDVLRAVSVLIQKTVQSMGDESDLIGHLDTDKFLVLTTPANSDKLKRNLQARLSESIEYFYPMGQEGQESKVPGRIDAVFAVLTSDQGPYEDLDALKNALRREYALN